MKIPIALHSLALAAMAAGPSVAQDAKPEGAKPAERRVEAIRKLDVEPIVKPADIQVFTYPDANTSTALGISYLQTMDGARDQAVTEWHTALQDWQRLGSRGLDGVGADLTPADDAVRAQLKLPEGQGLVVTSVADGGPAAKAGLKANDILLTLDGKPLAKPEDLLSGLAAIHSAGKAVVDAVIAGGMKPKNAGGPVVEKLDRVPLVLIRDGKALTITVKPEVRVVLGSVVEPRPSYFIGTPANPIDETLRVHLGLAQGHGLVVSETPEAGSPAARAEIRKNDILLSFNGQLLKDVETLRAEIQSVGPKPAKVEVVRAGKPLTLSVTPEPRKVSEEVVNSIDQMLRSMSGQPAPGVPVMQDLPVLGRLYRIDGANGQPQAILNPTAYAAVAPADLSRKIDDLTAQVQALTRAVDELRKTPNPNGYAK